MGKLGVGIGDDFPVEDGQRGPSGENAAASDPGRDAEYEKRREDYRKARDAWREQRHKMRDAWREKRRAYREQMRARYGDAHAGEFGHGPHWGDGHHWGFGPHRLFQILVIVGLVMLAIAIFSHIYILFGLVVLAGLYFAYRGGFDHFDFGEPPHSAPPPASPPGATS